MTEENTLRLHAWAELYGKMDSFVILKEDEKGRYVEYAFQEGCPHDNRCLSWYDKMQPAALKRNGHDIKEWETNTLHKTGEIYELAQMSCGLDSETGDEHCSPGHPRKKCVLSGCSKNWTYEEPVKCGCWLCKNIYGMDDFSIKLEDAEKFIEIYNRLCKGQTANQ